MRIFYFYKYKIKKMILYQDLNYYIEYISKKECISNYYKDKKSPFSCSIQSASKNEIIEHYEPKMGNFYDLGSLKNIIISPWCYESYPCKHDVEFLFEDGHIINEKCVHSLVIYDFLIVLKKEDKHFEDYRYYVGIKNWFQ